MSDYTENDLIYLAKRFNNTKRNFLLINPLQSKHLPISPTASIDMLETVGQKVAKKYSTAKLVVGFSETATAIGYVVAKALGDCNYITTTRENLGQASYFEFKEEHSHAVDQKLCIDNIEKFIFDTNEIILVDDEFTTGKTILNFINQLKKDYPIISQKKIVATSIINRVNDENTLKLKEQGIVCEYLIKPSNIDYEEFVKQFDIVSQEDYFTNKSLVDIKIKVDTFNVRKFSKSFIKGVNANEYYNECINISDEIINSVFSNFKKPDNILILGTEEFMYPSILLGKLVEEKKIVNSVKVHATTRSPIGILDQENYPIKKGFKLNSFYENDRETFIYNLENYDKVIIFTDSTNEQAIEIAIKKMAEILDIFDIKNLILLKGGYNV